MPGLLAREKKRPRSWATRGQRRQAGEDGARASSKLQTLSVDIQLWMAMDSVRATLAVKRRLACEMVKCWQQVVLQFNTLIEFEYVIWRYECTHHPSQVLETEFHMFTCLFPHQQAAAYYYHGVLLDEGNTEKSHATAVAALQAADGFLKESKRASEAFNVLPPTSRLFFSCYFLVD
ncbi:hypothetical protein GW17_00033601 [Ensete ventricosum]|nr:hypothetical protein GW17_00033601 [Ensete ventricosum]